jgi:hypothetical protein
MTLPEVRPAAAVTDEPEHPGSSREPFLRLLTQVMESGHVSDNFRIAITAPREITFTFKGTAVFSRAWFEPLHLLLSSQGSPPPSRGRRLHLQGDSDFTFKGTATSPSGRRRLHLQGDGDFTSRGRRLHLKGTATSPSRGRRLHLQGGGDFTFRETATSSSGRRRLHLQGDGDFTFKGAATSPSGDGDFTFKGRRTSAAPGSACASRGRRSAAAPGFGPLRILLRGQRVALTFKGSQRTPSPSGATR